MPCGDTEPRCRQSLTALASGGTFLAGRSGDGGRNTDDTNGDGGGMVSGNNRLRQVVDDATRMVADGTDCELA